MAQLLALDTSTTVGSVAIGDGERLLAEVTVGGARQSAALMPAIRFALEQAGLDSEDLGGVVVGAGPGSFTGVRIAAAAAKGIASALELPFFAYSSLLALAATTAHANRPVCALLDARRGEVYAACYRFPDFARVETLLQPRACRIADAIRDVAGFSPVFAGDGALRYRDGVAAAGPIVPGVAAVPRASALLWLTFVDAAAGRVAEPRRWQPEYIRPSGAERSVRA